MIEHTALWAPQQATQSQTTQTEELCLTKRHQWLQPHYFFWCTCQQIESGVNDVMVKVQCTIREESEQWQQKAVHKTTKQSYKFSLFHVITVHLLMGTSDFWPKRLCPNITTAFIWYNFKYYVGVNMLYNKTAKTVQFLCGCQLLCVLYLNTHRMVTSGFCCLYAKKGARKQMTKAQGSLGNILHFLSSCTQHTSYVMSHQWQTSLKVM